MSWFCQNCKHQDRIRREDRIFFQDQIDRKDALIKDLGEQILAKSLTEYRTDQAPIVEEVQQVEEESPWVDPEEVDPHEAMKHIEN